jgi:tagatose 1,6-diphosphate aldolase GatY/KbaY
MSFVAMKELAGRAFRAGYAVPAFCAWSAEVIDVVLQTAERLHAPVILMSGPGEFSALRPAAMAATARALHERYAVPAALHLDHADSIDLVRECIECGYTSVMLDFSTRPLEENVRGLKEVVSMARGRGITVEGEIGHVGRADESTVEGGAVSALTDPAQAADYHRRTDVDLLAVSVGNKHGFYRGEPHIEFELLADIHKRVPIPLVMHGGTGIPEKDLQRSISLGIAKVNIASELVHVYRKALTQAWETNAWPPAAYSEGQRALVPIIERWIRVMGADGKA